ncbi:ribbon-helix-helix domain-containing protein [Roseomonas mucosa]|uniref:ribbon-helix-helix domain-containing protein n=1 Tax=Roseomonas mucosa TaxID=207340 RepID=UPI0028CC8F84|nr:ribbon-helix-helix domain-containing protein [Roseomonas mucosa]MDT8315439.1 ribbon-helix-helix domain-containing protein [Roseomonas mucosa]MDT8361700.1 ribbon-helix-helix domain-containing protein [Roseomonas mucosa]
MPTARWSLIVSRETDEALRQVLAAQGRARKGELSRFVEDAVRARILEFEAAAAKHADARLEGTEVADAIGGALGSARRRRGRAGAPAKQR